MSLADKPTTEANNLVSLMVKIILLQVTLLLAWPLTLASPAAKQSTIFFNTFNSTFQLVNGISSYLQKLIKYFNFNGTAIVAFLKFPFAPFAAVFFKNVSLYLTDFNLSVFTISALKLVTLSLEQNHKLPVVPE